MASLFKVMTMNKTFSFIIPIYNRPEEMKELLESLCDQDTDVFEVVVIEDGSTNTSEKIVASFNDRLPVSYFFKTNSGPGASRNFGMKRAKGNYFIILDSDCVLPPGYLSAVKSFLASHEVDFFGGPDAAPSDFSHLQKAINYSMTSPLTTGGIRGGKQSTSTYYPRGFNMGMKAMVFKAVKGYDTAFKCGEDVELSIRIKEAGYKVGLIPEAVVWHKRRSNLGQFYKQVRRFGSARIALARQHKGQMKATHAFPAVFMFAWVAAFALHVTQVFSLGIYAFHGYFLVIAILSSIKHLNPFVGLLSMVSTAVMFAGYASGFMAALVGRPAK